MQKIIKWLLDNISPKDVAASMLALAIAAVVGSTVMLTLVVVQPSKAHYSPLSVAVLTVVFMVALLLLIMSIRMFARLNADNMYSLGWDAALKCIEEVTKAHDTLRARVANYHAMLDGKPVNVPANDKPQA